jgi:hypothetical protein
LERILRDRDHFTRWKLTQKWFVLFFPTRTFVPDRAMRISAQNLMHFLMEICFEIQGHSTNCIAFWVKSKFFHTYLFIDLSRFGGPYATPLGIRTRTLLNFLFNLQKIVRHEDNLISFETAAPSSNYRPSELDEGRKKNNIEKV